MSLMHRFSMAYMCLFVVVVSSNAFTDSFERVYGFPQAAPGAFGIKAEALPDGRWVVWNGDTVYLQNLVGGDGYTEAASGYEGDPGFIAVSPDGHTVLLGAGQSGKLCLFDTSAPHDYVPGSEAATVTHYYGAFLTPNLVVLDKATADFTTSELVVVDLSAPSPVAKQVMLKPVHADLAGTEYGVSACLTVDAARTTVYTMGLVYDGWDLVSSQLKRVSVSALVNAYNSKSLLDWNTDAVAIGAENAFFSGGPAGISLDGHLLIGGFGGVQRVNSVTAAVLDTYDPAGSFDYYGVAYNPYTDTVLPMVADPVDWSVDVVYAPHGAFAPMPAVNLLGVLALSAIALALGWRRLPAV